MARGWWRREDGDGLSLGVGGFAGGFCGSWFQVFGWGGGLNLGWWSQPGLGVCADLNGLRREGGSVACGLPEGRNEEEKRNEEREKKKLK